MKITIFEGTPEEYKLVAESLGKKPNESTEKDKESIDVKEAYRAMLKRAPIHQGQRDLYKILSKGEMIWTEYNKKMGRTPEQIRGVHGALGRRINGTPEIHQAGLAGNMSAISNWDNSTGKTSLKPLFIEVLKEEELI
jgi:hypothetical protein